MASYKICQPGKQSIILKAKNHLQAALKVANVYKLEDVTNYGYFGDYRVAKLDADLLPSIDEKQTRFFSHC